MNWPWIWWQVTVPVVGPIALAAIFLAAWSTGPKGFSPDYFGLFGNVSPWALTFYSLTLLGSTLHTFWPKLSDHRFVGGSMLVIAAAVCVYAGFIAIWRQDTTFVPGTDVYLVTGLLLAFSVTICYIGASKD